MQASQKASFHQVPNTQQWHTSLFSAIQSQWSDFCLSRGKANCESVEQQHDMLRIDIRQGKSKGRHADASSSAAISKHGDLSSSLPEQQ